MLEYNLLKQILAEQQRTNELLEQLIKAKPNKDKLRGDKNAGSYKP